MLAAAQTTSGPSVTVGGWTAWLLIAGALAVAVAAIWKVIVPLVRAANGIIEAANHIVDTWHILDEIAKAFRPNGHPSLPETVHKISATQDILTGKLVELDEKVGTIRHDIIGVKDLPALSTALGTVPTVVAAVSRLADEVKALRSGGSTP